MTDFNLSAKSCDEKAKKIRQDDKIPAIVYGKNFDNKKVCVDKFAFMRLFREAGSSNLVDLNIDDKENEKVLIHDTEVHPIDGSIEHIDFLKINMKEKIKTEIPIEYVGETPLVVEQEGSFIANKDSVEVECLPSDLVDHIDVDISGLTEFDQNIRIADIKVPSTIEIINDPEEVIALVQPPRSEEELAALDEEVVEDVEAVEVEKGGEKPEEGEEAKEGETPSEETTEEPKAEKVEEK